MYRFSYQLTEEEEKNGAEWLIKKKDECLSGQKKKHFTIGEGLILMVFGLYALANISEAITTAGAFLIVAIPVLLLNSHVRYMAEVRRIKKRRRSVDISAEICVDEHIIQITTPELSRKISYNAYQRVFSYQSLLILYGKTQMLFIPKRAVCTADEAAQFKKFLQEQIESGSHRALLLEELSKDYTDRYPYAYLFERTLEELAGLQAELQAASIFSKKYWAPGRVKIWIFLTVFMLILSLVFYSTPVFILWSLICAAGLIWFAAKENRNNTREELKKEFMGRHRELLNQDLCGTQFLAFGPLGLVVATARTLTEVPLSQIGSVDETEKEIRFLFGGKIPAFLPKKVFAGEGEKDEAVRRMRGWLEESEAQRK